MNLINTESHQTDKSWFLFKRMQQWVKEAGISILCRRFREFLALLDYVSRAHEIEIRPSVCGIDYL